MLQTKSLAIHIELHQSKLLVVYHNENLFPQQQWVLMENLALGPYAQKQQVMYLTDIVHNTIVPIVGSMALN